MVAGEVGDDAGGAAPARGRGPGPRSGWRSSRSPRASWRPRAAAAGRAAPGPRAPGDRRGRPSATSRPGSRQVRGLARRAARPAASWSGCRSRVPRGEAQRRNPRRAGRSAAASSSSRAASPVSGSRSRITSAASGAEGAQRGGGLRGPPRCERGRGGVAPVRALAVGDRHQPQPGARRRQQRDQAAGAEHLVVGVRGHDHGTRTPTRPVEPGAGQRAQPRPGRPGPPRRCRARRWDAGGRLAHHAAPCSATSSPSRARSRSA